MQIVRMPTDSGGLLGGLLKPEELWGIDTKIDDGRPGTGQVVVARWSSCTNGAASTADFANANYILNPAPHQVGNRCAGLFRNFI